MGLGLPIDDQHWLCVDPVHLGFRERSIVVHDPAQMTLSLDDAREIAVSVAPTLAVFGELHVDTPLHWHLRLRQPAPHFTPLESAISAQATVGLCADKSWQIALNEIQMSLHRHPVNLKRTAAGQPVINSLWPWGDGPVLLPGAAAAQVPTTLYSNHPCLRGLALHYGQMAKPLPTGYSADILEQNKSHPTDTIIGLDALGGPARSGDAQSWREALVKLDEHWFGPLARARSADTTIYVIFPGREMAHWLTLTPPRWWNGLRKNTDDLRRRLTGKSVSLGIDALAQSHSN